MEMATNAQLNDVVVIISILHSTENYKCLSVTVYAMHKVSGAMLSETQRI